jgi:aromatic-L-amino-acid/L-tryptophan decarboxylase
MSGNAIDIESLRRRHAPLAMDAAAFREIGHRLVDDISHRLSRVPDGRVTPGESPSEVRRALQAELALPSNGADAASLVRDTTGMLFDHSLFNGHPRFFGYITASPAPIAMLGDFLASALNQNVGAWNLAPIASEMESQAVRWIAELIGYRPTCGGLLVSGGNMANFVCLLAARAAKAPWVRTEGLRSDRPRLLVYASTETHTWLHKAADMSGLGTDAIRWVPVNAARQIDLGELRTRIDEDRRAGHQPFLVVGNAGTVATGTVDPLGRLAALCREEDLWFHVDGAYGALAAQVAGAPADLAALANADSVAVDPHKWLYAPLEAGCALVKDPATLRNAFAYHPAYYRFDEEMVNYYESGPQNSRGFRALKVWLALRQVGRAGYYRMIADDIRLAEHLRRLLDERQDFQVVSRSLSIATFRYVPADLASQRRDVPVEEYLNRLNQQLLSAVEKSGEAFLSNAVDGGTFLLRVCIVNFHTSLEDIEAVPPLLARLGAQIDSALRGELALTRAEEIA